ncbi:hypothetical protein PFISCL1PPCAC_29017 [Pristionchus fissidentatus]|uniref:Uncharacterized protein n=1 Tax=Pristionchus fissidentatus TaxID=1538716 RepID=A0AAV5X3G8_9BILA|nr:hypothetical protein PFISCL1PPCAC_29017 [Pristionchus fissidentatus]
MSSSTTYTSCANPSTIPSWRRITHRWLRFWRRSCRRSPSLASLAMDSLVNCTYRLCSGYDSSVKMTPGGSTESVTADTLPVLLTQIESVGETYPQSLAPHLGTLRRLARFPGTSRQIERILTQSGIVTDDDVTIISIKSGAYDTSNRDASCDSLSLLSKRSLPPPSSTSSTLNSCHLPPYVGSPVRPSYGGTNGVDASAIELDKNTQNLANLYQSNRSSSSLSKAWSRSYGSMLQSLQQRSGSDALQSGSNGGVAAAAAAPNTNTGSRESSSTHLPSRASIAPLHMLYPPLPLRPSSQDPDPSIFIQPAQCIDAAQLPGGVPSEFLPTGSLPQVSSSVRIRRQSRHSRLPFLQAQAVQSRLRKWAECSR